MKNLIKFILFLIYTVGIFFIDNYILLGLITIFNIILMLIIKINLKNAIKNPQGLGNYNINIKEETLKKIAEVSKPKFPKLQAVLIPPPPTLEAKLEISIFDP